MRIPLILLAFILCGFGDYDPGGDTQSYIIEALQSWKRPMRPIERQCDSSCNAKLSGNYCIQRDGSFGVHASHWSAPDNRLIPPQYNAIRLAVPACFRRLADSRRAWDTFNFTFISARDVIAACPQLPVCR
jgi:hypothetical protein